MLNSKSSSSFRGALFLLREVWNISPARILLAVFSDCFSFSYGAFYTLLFFRYFLNAAQAGDSMESIVGFFVLFMAMGFAVTLVKAYSQHICFAKTDPLIKAEIQHKLHKHAMAIHYAAYEAPDFYDRYAAAASHAGDDALTLIDHTGRWFASIFALILNMAFAVSVDPGVLMVALLPAGAVFFLQRGQNRARQRYETEKIRPQRETEYARRTIYLREYAQDMRTTAIYRAIGKRFSNGVQRLTSLTREHGIRVGAWRFACEFSTHIVCFLSLHGYIAWRYSSFGAFQLGDYTSLQGAAVNFTHFIEQISEEAIEISRIGTMAEFLRAFLATPCATDHGTKQAALQDEVALRHVSFRYPNAEADALHDISFSMRRGEKIALVGHNGAGKTTLVKLLLRLYEPTSGEISMDKYTAQEYTQTSWRDQFVETYQDFQIYAATIAENVLMHPCHTPEDEAVIWRALCGCGLEEKVRALPRGIHSALTREFDRDGVVLSGGEAQRIALARIFASNAPVAVLDEPSAALDPMGEYRFFESLMNLCGDKAILFVSHRLSSVTMADTILFMENGTVVERGNHAELMRMNARYAHMFRTQAQNYLEEVRVCAQ